MMSSVMMSPVVTSSRKLSVRRGLAMSGCLIVLASSVGRAGVVFTAVDLDRAMKSAGRNIALADTAVASKDFEGAKVRVIRAREALSPTVVFWKNENRPDAVAMVKAATAKLDDFDVALSANPVDPKSVAAAASAVAAACQACHTVYREQDPSTKEFRPKLRSSQG